MPQLQTYSETLLVSMERGPHIFNITPILIVPINHDIRARERRVEATIMGTRSSAPEVQHSTQRPWRDNITEVDESHGCRCFELFQEH